VGVEAEASVQGDLNLILIQEEVEAEGGIVEALNLAQQEIHLLKHLRKAMVVEIIKQAILIRQGEVGVQEVTDRADLVLKAAKVEMELLVLLVE